MQKTVNEIFVRVCVSTNQRATKQTQAFVEEHIIRMCRSMVIMSGCVLCVFDALFVVLVV